MQIVEVIEESQAPAVGDCLAKIVVKGNDTAGNKRTYAYIEVYIADPTSLCHEANVVINRAWGGCLNKPTYLEGGGNI